MAVPQKFSTSASPTHAMTAAGFSWTGLKTYAEGAIKVLESQGDTAIDMIEQGFILARAVTGRDMVGIFTAFSAEQRDVQLIIKAIQDEFGTS